MTAPGDWLAQPTVARLPDGRLFALHRDRKGKRLWSQTSTDEGRTWSKATPKMLPNNNSGIQLLCTRNGTLVLVFNNKRGWERTPLSVALSFNGGDTWPSVRDLDTLHLDTGADRYSYPSLTEGMDGLLHITYTWRRQTIKCACCTPPPASNSPNPSRRSGMEPKRRSLWTLALISDGAKVWAVRCRVCADVRVSIDWVRAGSTIGDFMTDHNRNGRLTGEQAVATEAVESGLIEAAASASPM